jgi:hypothetical protein
MVDSVGSIQKGDFFPGPAAVLNALLPRQLPAVAGEVNEGPAPFEANALSSPSRHAPEGNISPREELVLISRNGAGIGLL